MQVYNTSLHFRVLYQPLLCLMIIMNYYYFLSDPHTLHTLTCRTYLDVMSC